MRTALLRLSHSPTIMRALELYQKCFPFPLQKSMHTLAIGYNSEIKLLSTCSPYILGAFESKLNTRWLTCNKSSWA
jgi:hypothetical protein